MNLNDGLKLIGDNGFAYSRVDCVTFPDSLEQLGDFAYSNANRLSTIVFASSGALSKISDYAFQYTYVLKEVSIPEYITTIGINAFNCSGLTNISFDENSVLEKIGMNAFSCTSLRKVSIPDSVKVIEGCAFYYCWQLN